MHIKWVFKHFRPQSKGYIYILAALWITGLILGIILSCVCSQNANSILYGAMLAEPSPLYLLCVCVLPVAFSAIAFASPLNWLAYIAVFLFAVSHSFCAATIYTAVGSAAWLLRPMLLFAASCTSVLMWWLLLQNNAGRHAGKKIRFAILMSCIVCIVDLFLISPLVGDFTKVLLEGFA